MSVCCFTVEKVTLNKCENSHFENLTYIRKEGQLLRCHYCDFGYIGVFWVKSLSRKVFQLVLETIKRVIEKIRKKFKDDEVADYLSQHIVTGIYCYWDDWGCATFRYYVKSIV